MVPTQAQSFLLSRGVISLENLINNYGSVLTKTAGRTVRDAKLLPARADEIGTAILTAISFGPEDHQKEMLRVGFMELASFLQLSEAETKSIEAFEVRSKSKTDSELLELASTIADNGELYLSLQTKVLERQTKLMSILKRFESGVGEKAE